MAISRLYDFQVGNVIQSEEVDGEFNQLVAAVNNLDVVQRSFSATNPQDTAGGTSPGDDKLIFATEDWDISGVYANGTFTPGVPGIYRLTVAVKGDPGLAIALRKNGVEHRTMPLSSANSLLVQSDADDYFEVWATASSLTFVGSGSFFQGELVGRTS